MKVDLPESVRAEGSAHVNINRVELSDRTMAAVALAFSTAALAAVFMLLMYIQVMEEGSLIRQESLQRQMTLTEREARVAQQDAMLLKATLIAHGIKYEEDQLHKEDK